MKLSEEQVLYVDLPEISETFSDSIGMSLFDGQTVRIEFCVTRFDAPTPPKAPTAKKYPICRLVLTPEASVTLFNQLSNMIGNMKKQGLVTKEATPSKQSTH